MPQKPIPLKDLDPKRLKQIRAVAFDIDDTLSTHGQLTAEAYASLWNLKAAGYKLVPITGRPAGWCDHIARFWPVDAVVGENGAFTFYMEKGPKHSVLKRLTTPGAKDNPKPALEKLGEAIRKKFPHAKWASDQAYREYDLAIDFCEDVPAWSKEDVAALKKLCEEQGAHAKVSSIHVNAWYGDYDKRAGFDHWLKANPQAPGFKEWTFVGDSPNDEPMFAWFETSIGVANLANFLDQLKNPPSAITAGSSGAGFVQLAEMLLKYR